MKYGCRRDSGGEVSGENAELLAEGLKAFGCMFWVRDNVAVIRRQLEAVQGALSAIAESEALANVLRAVHLSAGRALGLNRAVCIKYSSVPSVLRLDVDSEGEGECGCATKVRDVVVGSVRREDLEGLRELYGVCVRGLGCDPALLATRLCQVEHAIYSALRSVEKMDPGSDGRNGLVQVAGVLLRELDELRAYTFKTSNEPRDFGSITGKVCEACERVVEDDFVKDASAGAIIAHTLDIIAAFKQA